MELSLIEKIGVIFRYLFSSFLSIEMFIISLLLFLILICDLKKNIFISYTTYVRNSFDSFVKAIMNYIYFPSTIVYFFIMMFVAMLLLYTLFSKKLSVFKKIVNYSVFSILFFFFMSFLTLASYNSYDLMDIPTLYENDTILSLVQLSNLLLFLWILFTGFYYLYHYFKKKFD